MADYRLGVLADYRLGVLAEIHHILVLTVVKLSHFATSDSTVVTVLLLTASFIHLVHSAVFHGCTP